MMCVLARTCSLMLCVKIDDMKTDDCMGIMITQVWQAGRKG